ncbi:PDZ domain-containing protein [Edaphobacter flagellatus]|uniref:PDZ domain-containing protein n=1 Tax=Edaphobacter flagellatus TaxID=1933044 RepID=UPI0021B1B456|nr:PDZ domain-containing protein [Edaphobacter flagellatus]
MMHRKTHSSLMPRTIAVLVLAAGVIVFEAPAMFAAAQSGTIKNASHSTQGYLGIDLRDVSDDQITALKLKEAHGAEIVGMDHDGPACKSGMLVHDVVLQMNGQQVEGEEQLRRMLRETPAGRQVTFTISRDGQQRTITTQMANRDEVEKQAWENHYSVPEPEGSSALSIFRLHGNSFFGKSSTNPPKESHNFLGINTIVSSSYTGAKLEVMGPQLAQFFGVQGSSGLLVRSVEPRTPAASAGLRAGDVVVKINSVQVVSGSDWTKTIHENRGRPVNIVVLRDRHEQTITMTPDAKKRSSADSKTGLEDFFGYSDQAEETRATLAELAPMFDALAARMRKQLEDVRSTPEMDRMIARMDAWAANPDFQLQMTEARKQVTAAASAARTRLNSPEMQQKMACMRAQMRDMMRLD